MSVFSMLKDFDLGMNGHNSQDIFQKKKIVEDIESARISCAKQKVVYYLLEEVIGDLELEAETLSISEEDNILLGQLLGVWSYTHLLLSQQRSHCGVGSSGSFCLDQKSCDLLADRLEEKINGRMRLAGRQLNIETTNESDIVRQICEMKKLKEKLILDIQLKSGELRESQNNMLQVFNGETSSSIYEIFCNHRRHIQPKLDLAKARLLLIKLTVLQTKLDSLLAKARFTLYSNPDVLHKLNKVEHTLRSEKDQVRQEVSALESTLNNYESVEDEEYSKILIEYGHCQRQLENRKWALQEMQLTTGP